MVKNGLYTEEDISSVGSQDTLGENLEPEKVQNALHRLQEQTASDFLRALQPLNFIMFLYQLGVPEKKYKYGRDSHGSNVKYTTRTKITSTSEHGFPGRPEAALVGYLEKTKDMTSSYSHTNS